MKHVRSRRFWMSVGVVAIAAALSPTPSSAQLPATKSQVNVPGSIPSTRPCAGETELHVVTGTSRSAGFKMAKSVNGQWSVSMHSRGELSSNKRECSEKYITIMTEEPEVRDAMRACSIMGSLMHDGSKLIIDVKSSTPMIPKSETVILMTDPISIGCSVDG